MAASRILAGVLALGLALPVLSAERTLEMRLDAAQAIEIHNLVGDVRLVPGDGELVIRAQVRAESEALAAQLGLSRSERNGVQQVVVDYPSGVSRIRYDGGEFRRLNTAIDYMGRRVRVSNSAGEQVRADLEITVPAGSQLKIRNAVGSVTAERIDGELGLAARVGRIQVADGTGRLRADTGSGRVEITGFRGDVVADTGSGRVTIENVLGNVKADTGSGSVALRGIDGDIVADTGSGSVAITDARARHVEVDTGSGSVRLRDVTGSLKVDTGSGSVSGEGLAVGAELDVDTGSGSVSLAGDFGGVARLLIDTGSGRVDLQSTTPLSLTLDLSTGSGSFRVDLPSLSAVESSRRRFRAVAGNGEGNARISTGSGSIRISGP